MLIKIHSEVLNWSTENRTQWFSWLRRCALWRFARSLDTQSVTFSGQKTMCNAAWNGRQKLALGGKRCFTRSRWLRQTNDSRSYCAVGVIGLFCQIGNRLTAGGGGTSTAVNLAGAIVSVPVMARFTIVSCSSRRSVGRRVKTCILLRD